MLSGLLFLSVLALCQGLLAVDSRYIIKAIGNGGKVDGNPAICGDDVSCGTKQVQSCTGTNPVKIEQRLKSTNALVTTKDVPTTVVSMDNLFP